MISWITSDRAYIYHLFISFQKLYHTDTGMQSIPSFCDRIPNQAWRPLYHRAAHPFSSPLPGGGHVFSRLLVAFW